MIKGRIIRGVGGFYYVDTGDRVYQCRARGLFKKQGITPCVGDAVEIEATFEEEVEGYVVNILPRKNLFVRPPIANVDLLLVVMALKHPNPNVALIDRFLVTAEMAETDVLLCFNKTDLGTEEEKAGFQAIYGDLYPLLFLSGKTGEGVENLWEHIRGKAVALAGPSGVGKSTILNALLAEAEAKTGSISEKTGRGRHTTRHVEIFPTQGGGLLFDTPGFTSFDTPEAEEEDLAHFYPEMRPYLGQCRFDNCRHHKEPDCAVRKALEEGKISRERYDSYLAQLREIRERSPYE